MLKLEEIFGPKPHKINYDDIYYFDYNNLNDWQLEALEDRIKNYKKFSEIKSNINKIPELKMNELIEEYFSLFNGIIIDVQTKIQIEMNFLSNTNYDNIFIRKIDDHSNNVWVEKQQNYQNAYNDFKLRIKHFKEKLLDISDTYKINESNLIDYIEDHRK